MATGENKDMPDETFNCECTSCVKVNRHKKAVKYCVDCRGYCCESCVESHEIFPALEKHNLLDESSFKSTAILKADLPAEQTKRCKHHERNIVNIYCGNHDVIGCSMCMALDHRNCDNVHSIPDEIETLFQKSNVDQLFDELQEKQNDVKNVTKELKQILEKLNKFKTEAIDRIKYFKTEIESLVEHLEQISLNEVENVFRKLEFTLKESIKKAENEIHVINDAAADLQKHTGNKAQQFVSMKTIQRKLAKTENLSHSLKAQTSTTLVFASNNNIRGVLENFKTLGSVYSYPQVNLRRTSLYTINSIRNLHIDQYNDGTTSFVVGSCIMEDGTLLLADYNNTKLKRADTVNMSVTGHCVLPARPNSVCCTSKHEAAVILDRRMIQFVSLENKMTLKHKIHLEHSCDKIAYRDEKMYITNSTQSIYMYDVTGKLLQTVSGNYLFHSAQGICVSQYEGKMYVCDAAKRIIMLDMLGNHFHTLKDRDLSYASGVCTDERGNVFVSDFNSDSVLQLTDDGNKKLDMVEKQLDGVKYPRNICFDIKRCTLVVPQDCNNVVKLFQLQ